MPRADIPIHEQQLPRIVVSGGISLRADLVFTNAKGEENGRIRKRNEKLLRSLGPALQRVLLPEETVFYLMRTQSPLSVLEQLTAAWWTAMLAAAVLVITNKRVLFFPVKRDGSWRESVRSVQWGDLSELKCKGLLSKSVIFKSKDGKSLTYTRLNGAAAKKLAALAPQMLAAGIGEQSASQGVVQLCPDCRAILTAGVYSCTGCGLIFKNEKTMILRSIFLPGGGYFYTGHPLVALLPAFIEVILIFDIVLAFLGGLRSPQAMASFLRVLTVLAVFWGFETAVTILHCRRYVRDYIPEKRDPVRSQAFTAKLGG